MLKRSRTGLSVLAALAAGLAVTASSPTALAQASPVYAPQAYAPQTYAPDAYAPPAYAPPPAPYQPQASRSDYGRPAESGGYRPPAYNPAWVPQGYGANQAIPNQAAAPPPQVAAYSEPPRYSGGRYADWSDSDYRYRISAGDELSLRFLLNPDLNTGVLVGPDGRGVFP